MTGPQGMGTLMPIGDQYVIGGYGDDFNRADAGSIGGSWDANYLLFSTLSTGPSAGTAAWSIVSNKLRHTGIGPSGAFEDSPTSITNRRCWASIRNQTDFTTGNSRSFRLLMNIGRRNDAYCTYYAAQFGRNSNGPFVALVKWINAVSGGITLTSAKYPLVAGDVVRIRHDGVGGLYLDVNGTMVLYYKDWIHLRGLGVGLIAGGSNVGDIIDVDDFQCGPWAGVIPSRTTWSSADAVDRDSFGDGLWTKEPSVGNSLSITTSTSIGGFITTPNSSTDTIAWVDNGSLNADQFVEFDIAGISTVVGYKILLRSASASSGYYIDFFTTGSFPFNTTQARIGIQGGSVLNTSADLGNSLAAGRLRAEIQGSTIRIWYRTTAGAWSVLLSASDSSITAANTIRIAPNGHSGQGTPSTSDIVVGNIPSSVTCTVEKAYEAYLEPTTISPIKFDIQFSEEVTGFLSSDLVIGGTAASGTSVTLSGSGRSYVASVTGMTFAGTITCTVPASCCVSVFFGAMANDGSTSIDNVVQWTPSVDYVVLALGSKVQLDWWFNETSGTTITNHSPVGSGHNGTLSGTVTLNAGTGPNGRPYASFGGGKVQTAGSLTGLQIPGTTKGVSIVGMFRPTASRFEHFATNTRTTPRYHYGCHITPSSSSPTAGGMNFTHWGQLGSTRSASSASPGKILYNQWQIAHWYIFDDALDSDIKLQVNAQADTAGAESHTANDAEDLAGNFIVGQRADGAANPLTADVSRVLVFKAPLTSTEWNWLSEAAHNEGYY